MEQDYLAEKQLLDRYRTGQCSPEEVILVNHAFNLVSKSVVSDLSEPDYEKIRDEIRAKLPVHQFKPKPGKLFVFRKISVAAAIIAIVGLGIFYFNRQSLDDKTNLMYADNLEPGRHSATLTLANGRKIKLSEAGKGELAEEAGVSITKTAKGEIVYTIRENKSAKNTINILSTARGETYSVMLPDSSKVWLNAASSLKYPSRFTGKLRKVELYGEGYFEIAKDKKHPFVVHTAKQEVEVLGTHFNINSYADEKATKTTLLEGSVKIHELQNSKESILAPTQQAVLKDGSLNIRVVDPEAAVAWKNGLFIFDNENLQTIMRQLSRWYNLDVVYEDGIDPNQVFAGSISKFKKVSQALEILELTKTVKFKIEGRRITVMK